MSKSAPRIASLLVATALIFTACANDSGDVASDGAGPTTAGDGLVSTSFPPVEPTDAANCAADGCDQFFEGDETPVDSAEYLDLSLEEAQKQAKDRGVELRIARIDGEQFALTEDFSATRLTVEVENDKVVSAVYG